MFGIIRGVFYEGELFYDVGFMDRLGKKIGWKL